MASEFALDLVLFVQIGCEFDTLVINVLLILIPTVCFCLSISTIRNSKTPIEGPLFYEVLLCFYWLTSNAHVVLFSFSNF